MTGSSPSEPDYDNSFTCIPSSVAFRPERRTPRPLIRGIQTATVVGPAGEEIYTDKYGRVKVQFHWDREGRRNESSSCWIRCAQGSAGNTWGTIFTPRIGQEVVVSFIEGDPDRPLITGSVYNGEQLPPYDLPGEKTKSTIKTLSSPGGAGFNELRFEDKKGQEQVFVHAERNMDVRVEHDAFDTVVNDRNLIVKHDNFEVVEGERHEQTRGAYIEVVEANRETEIKKNASESIGGTFSRSVVGDVVQKVDSSQSLEVKKDLYISAGNIVIEATDSITIKVGDSYLAMDKSGVTIGASGDVDLVARGTLTGKGTSAIKLTTPAKAQVDAGQLNLSGKATVEVKGALTKVEASGVLTIQGSLVKIN